MDAKQQQEQALMEEFFDTHTYDEEPENTNWEDVNEEDPADD